MKGLGMDERNGFEDFAQSAYSLPGPRQRVAGAGQTVSTRYLRAAQAYMLISMPTGTSTIFGVFQLIRVSPKQCRHDFRADIKTKWRSKVAQARNQHVKGIATHLALHTSLLGKRTSLLDKANGQRPQVPGGDATPAMFSLISQNTHGDRRWNRSTDARSPFFSRRVSCRTLSQRTGNPTKRHQARRLLCPRTGPH